MMIQKGKIPTSSKMSNFKAEHPLGKQGRRGAGAVGGGGGGGGGEAAAAAAGFR